MRNFRRGFTALVVALLVLPPTPALSQVGGICPGITAVAPMGNGDTITVSTTAIGFTTADISTTGRSASVAVAYVATNAIRYWDNGQDPTAGVGLPVAAGERFVVCGVKAIRDFRMIRQSADATVTATFYGGE